MPDIVSSAPEVKRTSPVTELRDAVAKLRKYVKHATDGPWVTSSVWSPRATSTSAVYSHAHLTGTVESEVVASGRIRSAYPGARPEDIPSARRLVTRTRSKAHPVGLDREGVVWVEGHGAYIALTHIDPVSESVFEAARTADAMAAATAAQSAPKDTLAPWLHQRFNRLAKPWESLSEDDRTYWEHEACAVRRAVARNGFKAEEATS